MEKSNSGVMGTCPKCSYCGDFIWGTRGYVCPKCDQKYDYNPIIIL